MVHEVQKKTNIFTNVQMQGQVRKSTLAFVFGSSTANGWFKKTIIIIEVYSEESNNPSSCQC